MCTVVSDWRPDEPVRLLALRDELVGRDFDDPAAWWPEHPGVVGGRDRVAGGTWAATDVASGRCALVLNRIERRVGRPSRGGLPLLAATHGDRWTEHVEHTGMASFTLVLAQPGALTAWTWDALRLRRHDLAPGRHMVTTAGVDTSDPKTNRWSGQLAPDRWTRVLDGLRPGPEPDALVVRHDVNGGVWATVFAQVITARPGRAAIRFSRTPWQAGTWTDRTWTVADGRAVAATG